MDTLGDLRSALGVRSIRVREGIPPPEDDGEFRGPTLAQEIHAKYAGKTQPESRQLVAILAAVQEVVRAQGLEVTPTAMFAALMARWAGSWGGGAGGVITVEGIPAGGEQEEAGVWQHGQLIQSPLV